MKLKRKLRRVPKSEIDILGALDEKIKSMKVLFENRMDDLKKRGFDVHEGDVYRITIFGQDAVWLDPKKVQRRIGLKAMQRCYSRKPAVHCRITEK